MRGSIGQGNDLIPRPRDSKRQEEQQQRQRREASEPRRAAGASQRQLGPRRADVGLAKAMQGQHTPSKSDAGRPRSTQRLTQAF